MTLNPARPVLRAAVPALRHHAARTRVLSRKHEAPAAHAGGFLRTWLHALLTVLRTRTGPRRSLLRTLLRRTTIRSAALARAQHAAHAANRRPRRLSASTGWFGFAAR